MSVKLNLLPPELTVSKNLNSFLKTVRMLGVVGIATFIIFGIGVGIFFIVSTISLNKITANVSVLEGQVLAQQKSEQQLILIKDRIAKINTVKNYPSALPNMETIEPFISGLSGTDSVSDMSIDTGTIALSVKIGTNSEMNRFIESLVSSDTFRSVDLTSFNLNPTTGYSIVVKAIKK